MSGMKVIDIDRPEPDAEMVRVLTDLLERAKSGKLVGAVVAFENIDGTTGNVMVVRAPVRILGEVEILKSDLLLMHCDTRLHKAGAPF